MLADMVLENQIAGYSLPLGSISRMVRAQAAHSPGHITRVGLGTMIDPRTGHGGCLNEKAREKPYLRMVKLHKNDYILYPAVSIDVAFIRATTV